MNVNLKTILEQFQNVERSFPIPSNQSVKIKIRFQNIGKRERERDGDLKARTRAKGLSHPSNGCRGGKRSKERSRVPLRIMNESRNKVQDEL